MRESRPFSCILNDGTLSNNLAEYNALLISLHLAQQMGVRYFEAYGDSVKGEYKVHHEDLISYHHATIQLANTFEGFYINQVSRSKIQR